MLKEQLANLKKQLDEASTDLIYTIILSALFPVLVLPKMESLTKMSALVLQFGFTLTHSH